MIATIFLAWAAQQASYTITVADPAREVVEVRLELSGCAAVDGPLELRLPERFAFVELAEPRLTGEIRRLGEGPAVERRGPFVWAVDPAGVDQVQLAWTVPLDHRRLPEVRGRDEYEFPYLREDHGMLVMGTLALAPEQLDAIAVRFVLPEGWRVHAPWPRAADGSFTPPNLGSLHDDLVAIGAWETHRETVRGMQLTLAFAPGQEALRTGVVARAAPIIGGMLDHFGVTPQEAYLVLFGEPTPGGYGGSPKTQSMTLFVGPDLPVDFALDGIVHLIAHEFHHTWMRARCQLADELRFLAEGFTDYFAYFVPWRLGMLSDADFRAVLERKLAVAEQTHAATGISLQEAGGPPFFRGGAAYQQVYAGGLALGLWLDLSLRQADHGTTLEGLLRVFYEHPRWQEDPQASFADLLADLKALGREDLAQELRELTTQTAPIDWVQVLAARGIAIERAEQPAELTIRANFDGTTITGIDPAGTGARIGLRRGDTLIEVNGVGVMDASDAREAFTELVEGAFALTVEGSDGTRRIVRAPRPIDVVYTLPTELIEQLRASAD